MESTGQEWKELTLWPADTPASPSPLQAFDAAKTTRNTFGRCSLSAFVWYDPATHCWRTSQATLVSDSDLFSQTWPRSGMTLNGTAYQRPPSAPRIFAIAYSLSQGTHGPNSEGMWPTATTQDHSTRYAQGGMPLGMAARLRDGVKSGDGHLNPEWVEWLMGFPIGWTDLED